MGGQELGSLEVVLAKRLLVLDVLERDDAHCTAADDKWRRQSRLCQWRTRLRSGWGTHGLLLATGEQNGALDLVYGVDTASLCIRHSADHARLPWKGRAKHKDVRHRDAEIDRAPLRARNGLQKRVQQDIEPLLWTAEAVHVLDNGVNALQHAQLRGHMALLRAWQDRGQMPLQGYIWVWF